MKNIGLRLRSNNKEIFSKLLQIGQVYCSKLNWRFLFLDGTYTNNEIIIFEEEVRKSIYGVGLSLTEIENILSHVDDLWNLLVIGQKDEKLLVKSSDEDSILFNSSALVIEYFDCSYWTVTSGNVDFIERVKKEFEEIYEIEYPLTF